VHILRGDWGRSEEEQASILLPAAQSVHGRRMVSSTRLIVATDISRTRSRRRELWLGGGGTAGVGLVAVAGVGVGGWQWKALTKRGVGTEGDR
jgi:hypothetical protein